MTKPFHPGGAARAGQMSALLAKHGFTSSPKALEAGRGFIQTVSTKADWKEIDQQLGKSFEISLNTYKPFACGIVIHPTIDACSQLKAKGVDYREVQKIELKVHPLVLELTGKKTPRTGLEGKFSIYYGAALGLVFGRASEHEYDDNIVNRPDVIAIRDKVIAQIDPNMSEASVEASAYLMNGQKISIRVEHAIGSLQNPMSDQALEDKFSYLCEPIIGARNTKELIQTCWQLGKLKNLDALLGLSAPKIGNS